MDSGANKKAEHGAHWVSVWTAMPQQTEEDNLPPVPFRQLESAFENSTIRQTLRVTTGGSSIRLRISNAFGRTDLHISAATVASPTPPPDDHDLKSSNKRFCGSRSILSSSLKPITFMGDRGVVVPPGAWMLSDPIDIVLHPAQVLTVSLFLRHGQSGRHITSHPGSRTQSWLCHGDYTASSNMCGSNDLCSVLHWYFIAGIEAWQPRETGAMVLLGDSITDGRCSTDNGNDRWPDLLFDRMTSAEDSAVKATMIAVLNQAAGGNRILQDGLGPSLLSRLDRDLFAQPGVRYVFVYEGVNDIGTADTDAISQRTIGQRLIQAYQQIIARSHAFGLSVFASPIAPFSAPGAVETPRQPYSSPEREKTRQLVNHWIRTSGAFDAVVDFDRVLRDPDDHSRLNPAYDSGDFLHPNVAGFGAMAKSFPLELFARFTASTTSFPYLQGTR